MKRRRLYGILVAILIALPVGCGGGDDDVVSEMPVFRGGQQQQQRSGQGQGRRARRARAEAPPAELPEGIERREFAEGSRDPFMRQFPDNQAPLELDADIDLGVEEIVDLGPLANYPIESLRLVAIMTRTAEPKAMFMLPDGSGLGVLARVDDRVGPNGTGRIVDIQPNRVVVSYEGFGFGEEGERARTLELTLRDPSLDIEAEFDPY